MPFCAEIARFSPRKNRFAFFSQFTSPSDRTVVQAPRENAQLRKASWTDARGIVSGDDAAVDDVEVVACLRLS